MVSCYFFVKIFGENFRKALYAPYSIKPTINSFSRLIKCFYFALLRGSSYAKIGVNGAKI